MEKLLDKNPKAWSSLYPQLDPSIDRTMSAARRLIPLLDRVLVERVAAAVKTSGGVLLPESAAPKVFVAMETW